jgi:hypothetical protein
MGRVGGGQCRWDSPSLEFPCKGPMLPLLPARVYSGPPGAHNNYPNDVRGLNSVYLWWEWAAARGRGGRGLAGPRGPRGPAGALRARRVSSSVYVHRVIAWWEPRGMGMAGDCCSVVSSENDYLLNDGGKEGEHDTLGGSWFQDTYS